MQLNQNICEHFHQVESKLFESLNIDKNSAYQYGMLLDKKNCLKHLDGCVAASYVQKIYLDLVYPVYVYLDWINNYLTIEKFCSDTCLYNSLALELINKGKKIIDEKYEIMNKI